jgi:hypothetical protein
MRCCLTLQSDRSNTLVCVYRDTEWNEFIVYYVIDGKKDEPSSYHTLGDSSEDKADAIAQAHVMAVRHADLLPLKARK